MLDNVGLRYPHRASGAKAPRTLRPLPLLRFAVSATGGAHLCSIQYYLRFWLSICRASLAVSALRIVRYCLNVKSGCISRIDYIFDFSDTPQGHINTILMFAGNTACIIAGLPKNATGPTVYAVHFGHFMQNCGGFCSRFTCFYPPKSKARTALCSGHARRMDISLFYFNYTSCSSPREDAFR